MTATLASASATRAEDASTVAWTTSVSAGRQVLGVDEVMCSFPVTFPAMDGCAGGCQPELGLRAVGGEDHGGQQRIGRARILDADRPRILA